MLLSVFTFMHSTAKAETSLKHPVVASCCIVGPVMIILLKHMVRHACASRVHLHCPVAGIPDLTMHTNHGHDKTMSLVWYTSIQTDLYIPCSKGWNCPCCDYIHKQLEPSFTLCSSVMIPAFCQLCPSFAAWVAAEIPCHTSQTSHQYGDKALSCLSTALAAAASPP